MIKTKCDSRGRIYLRDEIRSKYGRAFIVQEGDESVTLVPVPDDPVEDLAALGMSLPTESPEQIKQRIRRRAVREIARE